MDAAASASAVRPQAACDAPQQRSRRARAACELCRSKKVRCDARGGRACSNCTFDHVPCILSPRRLRKEGPPQMSTLTQNDQYRHSRGTEVAIVPSLAPRPLLKDVISDHARINKIVTTPPQHEEATGVQEKAFLAVASPSERTDTVSMPGKSVP